VLLKKQLVEPIRKTFKLVFEPDKSYCKEYETLLNSLFGLQFTNDTSITPYFTFGILSKGPETIFYVNMEESYVPIFKRKYAVVNPYIQFDEMSDPLIQFKNQDLNDQPYFIEGYHMQLAYKDSNKRLKIAEAEKLFLSNLINSMNNISTNDESIMEINLSSVNKISNSDISSKLSKGVFATTNILMRGLEFVLDETVMNGQLGNARKQSQSATQSQKVVMGEQKNVIDFNVLPKFNVNIKVMSKSEDKIRVFNNIKSMASAFADLSDTNSLIPVKMKYDDVVKRTLKDYNVLTTLEITQFLHLPDKTISSENIRTSNCHKAYDRNIPKEGVVFGESNNNPVAFPLPPLSAKTYTSVYNDIKTYVDNIVKPRLILGQQGTGKSEWVINYAIALARLGMSVIVVDPKNDTQQRLIESMPADIIPRLDYINFGDTKYPPAMNIFKKRHQNDATENSLIVTAFQSLMKKEFARSWGFHIQRLLRMSAEAILLNDFSTLNEFELMFTNREFREYMISKMEALLKEGNIDGKSHVKHLIEEWKIFNAKKDQEILKDIDPIMNQVGVFLGNRLIRAIVSQKESYDFRKAADTGRVVIINIPQGILGDNTQLLASMINKAIWLDIQSRADVDISKRYPVAWIIDEAHELIDDDFTSVLTQARAYRLGLVLITQGLSNFKPRGMDDLSEVVLTNCKNRISFRLGGFDAHNFADEMTPITPNDLVNCPDYHFYGKILLQGGAVSDPFFARAPGLAPRIRNYDEYFKKHRSGKFTIDEIEDELDSRLAPMGVLNKLLNMV
jgi:hypothetical protein